MRLTETEPGVTTPSRSSATPLGSVSLIRALIVPSAAMLAAVTFMTSPGRMKFRAPEPALLSCEALKSSAAPAITVRTNRIRISTHLGTRLLGTVFLDYKT